ncbi:PREDICTED: protein transport Sec1a-like [Ipomoea nil]|uniref:protein transport Sec1a-like n=1 Tax=Ipomoea nil TaxID=35883 RepID=UPI0009010C42|nr:PREDICTED: protein transport Sec1a-like [Ipomoea nil]
MSFSDSEYKNFRQVTRERLLFEMLRSSKSDDPRSAWRVLIMDRVTVKVLSSSCKMADITDEGISLVEDLFRRRQPLPAMDVIYFIQPTKENVIMFLSDMSGREPLYRKAYVYFSTPVPKDLVNRIKSDTSVLPRIGALREMNLEYFPMDSQAFLTDQDRAFHELFGEGAENPRKFQSCLSIMATRIATVFASLKEFPIVRYRAPKGNEDSARRNQELIPKFLASAIWECISTYKSTIPNYPQKETCDLLIVDRPVDQIAPIIHEWFYDAMCHDLLEMTGNKYVHEVPSKTGGDPEKKEVLLEDHDAVWLELRYNHIAEASEKLHDKFSNFVSKNKAAQLQQRDGSELSTRDIQKMVQALPQYNEQMEKLSLHVAIAGKINSISREQCLRDLGQVEQDLVFGDAGSKEVINVLRTAQDSPAENKLRLLMIYALVSPEKFEGQAAKLMQLAKLTAEDMKAINNMKLLEGASDKKKAADAKASLKFDAKKTQNNAYRKDRAAADEEQWALFRFFPVIEELIEQMTKGELPKDEFHRMGNEGPSGQGGSGDSKGSSAKTTDGTGGPRSMRSRRTPNYARRGTSDDGYSSDSALRGASVDFKNMGQRIFVFVVGGAMRSELRACHRLTTKLRREVVLGSTSIEEPPEYLVKLKSLFEPETDSSIDRGLGL